MVMVMYRDVLFVGDVAGRRARHAARPAGRRRRQCVRPARGVCCGNRRARSRSRRQPRRRRLRRRDARAASLDRIDAKHPKGLVEQLVAPPHHLRALAQLVLEPVHQTVLLGLQGLYLVRELLDKLLLSGNRLLGLVQPRLDLELLRRHCARLLHKLVALLLKRCTGGLLLCKTFNKLLLALKRNPLLLLVVLLLRLQCLFKHSLLIRLLLVLERQLLVPRLMDRLHPHLALKLGCSLLVPRLPRRLLLAQNLLPRLGGIHLLAQGLEIILKLLLQRRLFLNQHPALDLAVRELLNIARELLLETTKHLFDIGLLVRKLRKHRIHLRRPSGSIRRAAARVGNQRLEELLVLILRARFGSLGVIEPVLQRLVGRAERHKLLLQLAHPLVKHTDLLRGPRLLLRKLLALGIHQALLVVVCRTQLALRLLLVLVPALAHLAQLLVLVANLLGERLLGCNHLLQKLLHVRGRFLGLARHLSGLRIELAFELVDDLPVLVRVLLGLGNRLVQTRLEIRVARLQIRAQTLQLCALAVVLVQLGLQRGNHTRGLGGLAPHLPAHIGKLLGQISNPRLCVRAQRRQGAVHLLLQLVVLGIRGIELCTQRLFGLCQRMNLGLEIGHTMAHVRGNSPVLLLGRLELGLALLAQLGLLRKRRFKRADLVTQILDRCITALLALSRLRDKHLLRVRQILQLRLQIRNAVRRRLALVLNEHLCRCKIPLERLDLAAPGL
eukprot:comp22233_c0_seq1/m.52668 comp22233_c0_seq1/g.52668  ORF comp22233_c0_seq1/g.52668 comp22233_c0_seq1/m.52668 type:complete len:726 (+) comp22233_c0_seq1:40-2217(+)